MAPSATGGGRPVGVLLLCLLGRSFTNGFAPIISPTTRTAAAVIVTTTAHQQRPNILLLPSNHWHHQQRRNTLQFHVITRHSTTTTTLLNNAASSSSFHLFDEETTQKLILLAFEKAIEAGIPALFFIVTTWWFISMMRSSQQQQQQRGDGMMGRRNNNGSRTGARRGNNNNRGGGRRGGGMMTGQSKLGPVEELYDDIYDDLSGPDENNNIPPLIKLLTGTGGGGRNNNNPNNGIDRPTTKLNIGIPKKEYLKVTKLNSKYDSYRYSMVSATQGKAVAASELRRKGFEMALWKALGAAGGGNTSTSSSSSSSLGRLTPSEATALITLERDFLREGSELLEDVALLSREITNAAVLDEMEEMGVEPGVIDAEVIIVDEDPKKKGDDVIITTTTTTTTAQKDFFGIATSAAVTTSTNNDKKNSSSSSSGGDDKKKKAGAGLQTDIMKAVKEVEAINTQIMLLELDFIQGIVEILGPNRADTIRTTIVGNMISGEAGTLLKTLKERPLARVLSSFFSGEGGGGDGGVESNAGKNLYVTRFPGDVTASQLNELREEVTGILQVAKPGDEALLVLQSGGGTVTGYGLAAAQLQRFKAKNIKLTVCVEQVAASGGYMMCCTADRIVASPFAVLGSIGVISEIPNAYERLQREGIEFQTITAGKFKRTVTPTKKVTKEDLKKSAEDINEIFNLFKSFVASQRPQLDIESVATGDTWFGEDALKRGLCDELATADDVLLDFVERGYDLYEVTYDPTPAGVGAFSLPRGSSSSSSSSADAGMNGWRGVLKSMVRGVVSDVKEEIMSEISASMNEMNSVERRYMMRDDSADKIKAQD
jgi:signal peptide peptidase SppA